MGLYYDLSLSANSSGSTNTEVDHILGIAGATQGFGVIEVYGSVRTGTTVGAGALRLKTGGTSSAGAAATMNKRNPTNPSTGSSWSTAITSGGSPVVRLNIGLSQVGGAGGWVALTEEAAIGVAPGTGNKVELFSIFNTATQGLDMSIAIAERGW